MAIFSREQLVEALFNEYTFLCHDDFEPGVDTTPEDYLVMLKAMNYEELIGETSTDESFPISEYMEMWN